MVKSNNAFVKYLIFSIIFLIVAMIFFLSVISFFIWGLPLGSLFISLAIWNFAMWKFKKSISFKNAWLLFLLPLLGIIYLFYTTLGIPPTGFEGLLLWAIIIIIVIMFFKKIKD